MLVCVTTRWLPEITGAVETLDQPPDNRFVLDSREKFVRATGQERRIWFGDKKFTDRIGKGSTVATFTAVLLDANGSG